MKRFFGSILNYECARLDLQGLMKFNFLTPGMNIREYVTLNENIDRSQRDVKYFFQGFEKSKSFYF